MTSEYRALYLDKTFSLWQIDVHQSDTLHSHISDMQLSLLNSAVPLQPQSLGVATWRTLSEGYFKKLAEPKNCFPEWSNWKGSRFVLKWLLSKSIWNMQVKENEKEPVPGKVHPSLCWGWERLWMNWKNDQRGGSSKKNLIIRLTGEKMSEGSSRQKKNV